MVTKHIGQKLNFYECLQLLDKVAEYGIVERVGDCLNVFCVNEGWKQVSIIVCATVLADDIDGQTYYRETLKKMNVELSSFCEVDKILCAMR